MVHFIKADKQAVSKALLLYCSHEACLAELLLQAATMVSRKLLDPSN